MYQPIIVFLQFQLSRFIVKIRVAFAIFLIEILVFFFQKFETKIQNFNSEMSLSGRDDNGQGLRLSPLIFVGS